MPERPRREGLGAAAALREAQAYVRAGGIYERETLDETDRVPFFGELPLVEHLFKTTRKSDDKAELLIFVTPKIVKESFSL